MKETEPLQKDTTELHAQKEIEKKRVHVGTVRVLIPGTDVLRLALKQWKYVRHPLKYMRCLMVV